jgi:hypothetical protein
MLSNDNSNNNYKTYNKDNRRISEILKFKEIAYVAICNWTLNKHGWKYVLTLQFNLITNYIQYITIAYTVDLYMYKCICIYSGNKHV